MALTFQELGGSPSEEYSMDGFTARREFLVPWEKRADFVRAVFGTTSLSIKQTRVAYPGRKDVFAVSLKFEPFDAASVNPREIGVLKSDMVDYNGSFAKAVVRYRDLSSADRRDAALPEDGTSITYRMVIAAETWEIAPTGWRWSDTGASLPGEMKLRKRIPLTEHRLTWHQVVNPPWKTISAVQGKLNGAAFLGCAPGTLLFEGGEANKLYLPGLGLDYDPSPYVWKIDYLFRELAVKMGGTYGWNHVLREQPNGWASVTNGSTGLYDYADFQPLFRSSIPPDVPGGS